MQVADITALKKEKIPSAHLDANMEIYLMLCEGEVFILHDGEFSKDIGWLEYNNDKGQLLYITNDGEVRDFGIPINKKFRSYFVQQKTIGLAKIKNGEFINGYNYPLIKY